MTHPNTLKNLEKRNVYSKENPSPMPGGRRRGHSLPQLVRKMLEHNVSVHDVILGCTRKVTVAEATMLKLIKAAIVKEEPWAIQYILKEVLHNGVEKVEITSELSPAAKFILEKVGYDENMIDVTPLEMSADVPELAYESNGLFD